MSQVTVIHLRDHAGSMMANGRSAKTVSDRVMTFGRFFGFLLLEGPITTDPSVRLPTPKVGERLPKALPLDETTAFLARKQILLDHGRGRLLSSSV